MKRRRAFVGICAVARVAIAASLPFTVACHSPAASATAAGEARAASRTTWGDLDLQGIWGAGYLLTPLERPAKFAGKEFLTDDEVAALEKELHSIPVGTSGPRQGRLPTWKVPTTMSLPAAAPRWSARNAPR